jgi:hypothetical protein
MASEFCNVASSEIILFALQKLESDKHHGNGSSNNNKSNNNNNSDKFSLYSAVEA